MPKLSVTSFLRPRWTRSVPSEPLKLGSVLNIREGEQIIVTYTSAANKMKVFANFIREGLEGGDAIWYSYPDEESQTVRAKLKEYGVNVEKYEKDDTLHLTSLTEYFLPDGKLDYKKAVANGLNWWAEAKRRGYKHIREIEDFGDFSFANGQWQKYITDYWLDPRWEDPNVSEWVLDTKGQLGIVYTPLIMAITAINVEHMTEKEVAELLEALSQSVIETKKFFIDLLESMSSFSRSMNLNHEQLIGLKILLEFDPTSDFEKVVSDLAKENMANVESTFVFTSKTSPIHAYLAEQRAVKFFLTSISASIPEAISENEVLLPTKSMSLVLEAIDKVLETYHKTNVCFVFDILSELFTSIGQEKTFIFLRNALDMLSSEKITCLFLLNTSSHEPEVVSRTRQLFPNLLAYDKNGLKIVKT